MAAAARPLVNATPLRAAADTGEITANGRDAKLSIATMYMHNKDIHIQTRQKVGKVLVVLSNQANR